MKDIAFLFDLDGTITAEEILPAIGSDLMLHEEIRVLTDATLQGILPYDSSLKLRIELLKQVPISRVKQIIHDIKLNAKIVSFIKKHQNICHIVTNNLDVWITDLCQTLTKNIHCSESSYKEDSLISIKKQINKGEIVRKLRKEYKKIVVVGESINDESMFREADIKIAFGQVHNPIEPIIKLSNYVVFSEDALCRILNTLL